MTSIRPFALPLLLACCLGPTALLAAGPGDLNGSGAIDVGDAVPALRQRAGLAPETAKADPPTLLAVGLGDAMIPLIGVATAGYQIEGYRNAEDNKTDWAEFEDRLAALQYVPNFQKAGLAANHYEKFEEDFALLEALGVKTFRMSIEWARIEPEPGVGDPTAIDHYRAVFESLRAHGVTPVVTLQHFTLPAWTTDLDGSGLTAWENPAIIDRFVAYAAFCAETFGGYVDWWSPINEPNVLGFFGYFTPLLTPGIGVGNVQDLEPAFRALRNMAFAHAGAYDAIKQFDTVSAAPGGEPANVGVVVSMNLHDPAPSDDPVVQAQNDFAAGAWDYFFINGWLNAVTSGVLDYDLDQQLVPNEETGEGFQPFLANRTDFIGINYYGRQIVSADYCTLPDNTQIDCFSGSGGAFAGFPRVDPEGAYKTRLVRDETEVFAEGLRKRLTETYQRYGLPVLVAENGMFTYNHEERTGFLLDHFGAVQRAVVEDGTPVLGYLYWTFLDTFEWFYGWQPGYALVNVTQGPLQTAPAPAAPETFVRRPGRAAYLLGELSQAGALSEALETKYRAPAPAASGFLWGSAVSAYQVEGGDTRSDIHELCDVLLACKDPATQDAVVVGDAADHYNRYAEDFDLLGTSEAPGSLGLNAHRMAIDWARVETAPGVYDEAEIAHYSDVIDALRARGLEPVVTLHHLAFPKWALDPGDASADQGFANAAVRERFVAFVGRMAEEFGDRVDWWITINEPFFSGVARYLPELFFPADASPQDEALARAVHARLAFVHADAYRKIHEVDATDADGDGAPALVGITSSVNFYDPRDAGNPDDVQAAADLDYFFNWAFLEYLRTGALDVNIDGDADDGDATTPAEGAYPELTETQDFIGLNYFTRRRAFAKTEGQPLALCVDFLGACFEDYLERPEEDKNGFGWWVYPEGLPRVIAAVHELFPTAPSGEPMPILITENGAIWGDDTPARPEADKIGARQTLRYLEYLRLARNQGYPIAGYLYWTALDGFEIPFGATNGEGLLRVDFGAPELTRSVTLAAEAYKDAIASPGGATYQMSLDPRWCASCPGP